MGRAWVGCVVVNATGARLGTVPGKPESPVTIFATNESFASAKAGASGIGGAPVMAAVSGFWLRGRKTMLTFSTFPSKNWGKVNMANLLFGSINGSLETLGSWGFGHGS